MTQESTKHYASSPLCAQAPSELTHLKAGSCFYPLKLPNVSAKDQLLGYLIIIKLNINFFLQEMQKGVMENEDDKNDQSMLSLSYHLSPWT